MAISGAHFIIGEESNLLSGMNFGGKQPGHGLTEGYQKYKMPIAP